jgi:hypothetical protein
MLFIIFFCCGFSLSFVTGPDIESLSGFEKRFQAGDDARPAWGEHPIAKFWQRPRISSALTTKNNIEGTKKYD